MATARFEKWLETDLTQLPRVVALPDDTFTADAQANKVGVRVTKGGAAYTLPSGTVRGYIIKPDNTTVTVTGTRIGNTAYVILPASAYTAPGRIMVIIKLIETNGTTTLGACQCVMHRALTDTIVG